MNYFVHKTNLGGACTDENLVLENTCAELLQKRYNPVGGAQFWETMHNKPIPRMMYGTWSKMRVP